MSSEGVHVFLSYAHHDEELLGELELVAVKVLHGQHAADQTRRERFFRGARKMAQLRHPGIVGVVEEKCAEGGYFFLVMEYLARGDLRRAVLQDQVTPEERMRIILDVGEALHFAHEQGLIHRDVKPQNILLDARGSPKLTDFDLVRASDTTGGTRTGMFGTFIYAAPELLLRPQEADERADVYGLGMTVLFAFLGADLPPEVHRDASRFIRELQETDLCRQELLRAVAWEPEKRWRSVKDFCRALQVRWEYIAQKKSSVSMKAFTTMPEERLRYYISSLPSHLARSQQDKKLEHILTKFDFLHAKIELIGHQALILDYELTNNLELKLIQSAIRLSAHIIAEDPAQLAGQLLV